MRFLDPSARLPRKKSCAVALLTLLLAVAGSARAASVTGVVRNGTTGKVAAGVDVILIQLAGGMNSVANTKTDAQGHYKLDHDDVGKQPMLIRAVYNGVMFHQPIPPGTYTADVTVFDPSSDPKLVTVGSRVIVFQPSNSMLLVGEEYALRNESQPPLAYFNQKGDFDFEVPKGAELSQVSSWGPSGMPVVQGTIERGPSKYAIAYAFQPGDNGVRLSYQVPYPSNQATLHFNSTYAVQSLLLVAPPTVKVESAGFMPAGNEQGFNLYKRDGVAAGLNFDVSVSGTAPPPSASAGQQSGDQQGAQGADQVNGRDTGVAIQTMPDRLDSLRWIVIGGFAVLFALGVTFLWRRPVAVVAGGPQDVPEPRSPATGPRAGRKQQAQSAVTPAAVSARVVQEQVAPPSPSQASTHSAGSSSHSAAAVEVEVERSLDALKDRLFRLELRHQAGTISEEEYARERGCAEQVLRELLRG